MGDSASSLGPWHQAATLVLGETAMATSPTSPRPLTLADANKSHSLHAKQSFIEDLDGCLHLNEWYAACNLPAAVLVAIDKKNKLCQGGGSISAAKESHSATFHSDWSFLLTVKLVTSTDYNERVIIMEFKCPDHL